jgi:MoxR-like ATPase
VNDWLIYQGNAGPHDAIDHKLPPPPPWREFNGEPLVRPLLGAEQSGTRRLGQPARAAAYKPSDDEVKLVNAALYLRRPLLVTGKPGTGKSTLAHSVARELRLGPVLYWPITSRSNRQEGLYEYDAVARLQDASLQRESGTPTRLDIGRYLRLGPLGTALLPYQRPRVLLIDELDKSDIDLPNDLLTLFEEGEYEIKELSRIARETPRTDVLIHDGTDRVAIADGKVRCNAFPLVIITSNGERDFPPPFLRRCLRLVIKQPSAKRLADIVGAHLTPEVARQSAELIDAFMSRRENGDLATDQLLNAIFLAMKQAWPGDREGLIKAIMQHLNVSEIST